MRAIWSVATISFKEGIKSRLLFGIFLLALLLFLATTVAFTVFMRDIVKVAVDFSLGTVSFAGLLTLFFVGINLFAKDIDKRTIYMVISRPISRAQYLAGKFLGICLLVMAVTAFLGTLSVVPVFLAQGFYTYPEGHFSWLVYLGALGFIALGLMVLASVITLFSALTSNSFIALVLSLAAYLIGQSTETVRELLTSGPEKVEAGPLLRGAIEVAYHVFPNFSAFDLKTQAAHGLALGAPYLFWTALYALVYMVATVSLGAIIFSRREFP